MIEVKIYTTSIPQSVIQKRDFSYKSGNLKINLNKIERKLDNIINILRG